MRNPARATVFAVFFSMMISFPALAGEDIDEARDVTRDGLIEIINPRGEVIVTAWDRDQVRVTGELDDLAEDFIFEVRGNQTRIEVEIPRGRANWGDGSDLEVHVPALSRLSVEGISSDISVEGIEGGTRINTASGEIRAINLSKHYTIRSVSGDIDIEDCSGTGNVSNVSGEITLEADSPKLALETVSGDVEARLPQSERLIADAVSGDLDIRTRLERGGEIDVSSVSSDITLELLSPVDARIVVETGPGGDITNRLNDDAVEPRFPAMHGLRTELGDGSGYINLRTVSGDIRLDSDD